MVRGVGKLPLTRRATLGMMVPLNIELQVGSNLHAAWIVTTNWQVLAGLALYGIGAAIWLLVLARIDLSVAYPFVGLGFIVTMALGWSVLDEPVGFARLAGTLLVASGIWLVSNS
jgi:multidrug transporter EmrE-like cation transporter